MSDHDDRTLQILTGEAMWPDRVNRRWPGATFRARVRFRPDVVRLPASFSTLETADFWGVLVELPPGVQGGGSVVTASTDMGTPVEAWFETNELLAGDPESVVAAARYWELSWRYVGALRDALARHGIAILDEEPRDDAVTTASG